MQLVREEWIRTEERAGQVTHMVNKRRKRDVVPVSDFD